VGTTVRAVVEDVVSQAAPEEMAVVAALARLDDAGVARVLRKRGRGRADPLGFGVAEVVAIVTPVVWSAVDEACRTAVQSSVKSAGGRMARLVRRIVRRSRPAEEEPVTGATEVPPLTREQLALVHRRVVADARTAGLNEADAEALAERVVARLLLAASGDGENERA